MTGNDWAFFKKSVVGVFWLLPGFIIFPLFTLVISTESVSKFYNTYCCIALVILSVLCVSSVLTFYFYSISKKKKFNVYYICESMFPLLLSTWIFLLGMGMFMDVNELSKSHMAVYYVTIFIAYSLVNFRTEMQRTKNIIYDMDNRFDFNDMKYRGNINEVEGDVGKRRSLIKSMMFFGASIGLLLSNLDVESINRYLVFLPKGWDIALAGIIGAEFFFSIYLKITYQIYLVHMKCKKLGGVMLVESYD